MNVLTDELVDRRVGGGVERETCGWGGKWVSVWMDRW